MENYLFRVLREKETSNLGLGVGIYGKSFNIFDYEEKTLGDIIDNITTHVMKGNNSQTEFISCSKDLLTVLEKYGTRQIHRPALAIIKNHGDSQIQCDEYKEYKDTLIQISNYLKDIKNSSSNEKINEYLNFIKTNEYVSHIYNGLTNEQCLELSVFALKILIDNIRKIPLTKIKKMVIDASNGIYYDENYNLLFNNQGVKNKNGDTKSIINIREIGTARNSKEVLILNYIGMSDIKILTPLQYDILYSIIANNLLIQDTIIYDLLNDIDIFTKQIYKLTQQFDKYEKELYKYMYFDKKTIYESAKNINEYNVYISEKSKFLKKIIDCLNQQLNKRYSNDVYVLESTIDPNAVFEIGKTLNKTI